MDLFDVLSILNEKNELFDENDSIDIVLQSSENMHRTPKNVFEIILKKNNRCTNQKTN